MRPSTLVTAALLLAVGLPASATSHDPGPVGGVCRGTDARCYHDWGNFDPAKGYRVLSTPARPAPATPTSAPAWPRSQPAARRRQRRQKAVLKLGQDNGFAVDYTEDVTQLASARACCQVQRRDLPQHDQRHPRRRGQDRAAPVHARRRRLRRRSTTPSAPSTTGPGTKACSATPTTTTTARTRPAPSEIVAAATPRRPACRPLDVQATSGTTSCRSRPRSSSWPPSTRTRCARHAALGHPGHGSFHPVAWCQYYDGGRAWLTTLGHEVQALTGDQRFLGHLTGGVKSAMGMAPFCR